MKKILTIVLALLLFACPAFAAEWSFGSGMQTGSAAIKAGPGMLTQIIMVTDGTTPVVMDLYDNATTASGTRLIPTWTVTTSSVDRIQTLAIDNAHFTNGIYSHIVSGTPKYVILWKE
jgi:uncharacterized SAM-binding protein YcdF (DUF218 family)